MPEIAADQDPAIESATSPTSTSAPASTAQSPSTPPWERNGKPFDPARAWSLIENLRADLAAARTTPPAGPAGTGTPPAPVDVPDVQTLRADLVRERVARRFGFDDALLDLLGTGDEATLTSRAQTLADRLNPPGAGGGSPVPRRPVEQLRGGADPTTDAEETDPAKLAGKVRRGF
ncbi:hypothetical protein Val02_69110 [Virgisporangium aliadipatigenens]|uniref:Uncharacterized protein n=1 Tax=Virgisporangium aliadipatigenens TaxID=741659 RepID=A0A8J3YUD8_9ACTN|nr:hypothetical protein [Virgisporangium aliadipatigenens]GIJ50025.1 hypothetical protein Val02_69110 [Virgisporangium aliadipatigenens]